MSIPIGNTFSYQGDNTQNWEGASYQTMTDMRPFGINQEITVPTTASPESSGTDQSVSPVSGKSDSMVDKESDAHSLFQPDSQSGHPKSVLLK